MSSILSTVGRSSLGNNSPMYPVEDKPSPAQKAKAQKDAEYLDRLQSIKADLQALEADLDKLAYLCEKLLGNNHTNTSQTCILQALEQHIPSPRAVSGKMWYGVENFTNTEHLWNECDLVLLKEPSHIPYVEYLKDPAATLTKYGARIVGKNKGTKINGTTLESTPEIWDQKALGLFKAGRLGISTDFMCNHENDRLIGKVRPNYLALFEMKTCKEQNDRRAGFAGNCGWK